MERPLRVVVLGGGFTAVHACKAMRRGIRSGELDVVVVLRDNYLAAHGLIAEMITGRVSPGAILNPARRIFRPAGVHVAEIDSVDLENRTVVTSRSLDGALQELSYDQLIVALGSAEDTDAYPGLAEHAFRLKRYDDCLRLRNHILMMFELADIERDPEERRRLLTFFIAGGGFSGAELAGELADFARLLTKREFQGIGRHEPRVVLVHSGPMLLPELYGASNLERPVKAFPKLADYATKHAQKLGVEVLLNSRVAAATPNEVHLSDGSHVPTRTIVSAVGTKPNPLLDQLGLERDTRGRLVVDRFLRATGRDDIWAGGDCASVPHPHGGTCPPVALYACVHGRRIGANLLRSVRGKGPKPYRIDVKMQGVSIGRRTAVGEMGGLGMRGLMPWLGWRTVLQMIIPSWDRRVRLVADWLIWPFVGRDIAQVGPATVDDYYVEHNVFQPDELIFTGRRPTRFIHVIVEGQADVVRGEEPHEEVLSTVGPGDHVGRRWLEASGGDAVRATTIVRTVALRADQAAQLQRVLTTAKPLSSASAGSASSST